MSGRIFNSILVASALSLACVSAFAQDGEYTSYSPYSVFAIGDPASLAPTYLQGMGGVGVASRNHRYLNTVNPAAVSCRDSLAVMIDFNIGNDNRIYTQDFEGRNLSSASNVSNISGFAMSVPIIHKSAIAVGLNQYSGVGYEYVTTDTNPQTIAEAGNIAFSHAGNGGIYQVFAAPSVMLFDRLSLGAQLNYRFGNIDKTYAQTFSDAAHVSSSLSTNIKINSLAFKFGAQYEQKVGKDVYIVAGATYSPSSKVDGTIEKEMVSSYSTTSSENLSGRNLSFAPELGLGVSFNFREQLRGEFNYIRSDWTSTGFGDAAGFSNKGSAQEMDTSLSEKYKLGLEYVPNRNDIRYYLKRVAYRAGASFGNEYFTVNGNKVYNAEVTFGFTLPVFRWYNGLSFAATVGARGTSDPSIIREYGFKFTFGVNLFDIWFRKTFYD